MALGRELNASELAAYDVIPTRLARRARVVTVGLLPRGASGMTLGRHIFVLRDDHRDGDSTLLAHELVHVGQWADLGVIPFIVRYLFDYFRHLPRLRSHEKAYRAIGLEVHAYGRASQWAHRRAAAGTTERRSSEQR